jgi:hypothetical protein
VIVAILVFSTAEFRLMAFPNVLDGRCLWEASIFSSARFRRLNIIALSGYALDSTDYNM